MTAKEKNALIKFRNKDYESAYKMYKQILANHNSSYRYRNINNILTSIHYIFAKEKLPGLFQEFMNYFKEYLEIGKDSDNTDWANNILEDLLEYAIEIIFSNFSENQQPYETQKNLIRAWLEKWIIPFIDIFEIPRKRDRKIFYKVILQKIFRERTNFEREGHTYQNVINTKALCNFFLKLTENESDIALSRSNIYQLMAEIVYNDPQQSSHDYIVLTKKAVYYLDKSIQTYPQNQFAKKRKLQLRDSLTIHEQLQRFDHDVSSKISTLNSLIRIMQKKSNKFKELGYMKSIIQDIQIILDLSKDETPEAEDVDLVDFIKKIKHSFEIPISFKIKGEANTWVSNKGYLKVILTNLIKNSREAYARNKIKPPTPAVKITINFKDNLIKIKDWAGGIPEKLLRDNKLLEPYVSQKGIAQSTGLGLSLVQKACNKLEFSLLFESEQNSTTVILKKR